MKGLVTSTGEGSAGVYGKVLGSSRASGVIGVGAEGNLSHGVMGLSRSTSDSTSGVYGTDNSEELISNLTYGVHGVVNSIGDNSCGMFGEAKGTLAKVFGVKGITEGTRDSSSGVYGEALATTGMVNGVTGLTHSTGNDACGVQGIALSASGNVHGVLGMTHSTHELAAGVFGGAPPEGNSAAFLGLGDLRILTLSAMLDLQPVFDVSTAESQVNIYHSGSIITSFGGSSQRVAIQKVNSSATPTIPDNNFTIAAESPIAVATGIHGVTISCPECCTEPCGSGGGISCVCGSTLTVGSGTRSGVIKVRTTTGEVPVTLNAAGDCGPKVKSSIPVSSGLLSVARFEAYEGTPYSDSGVKAAIKGYWNSTSHPGIGVSASTNSTNMPAVVGRSAPFEAYASGDGVYGFTEGTGNYSHGVIGAALGETGRIYGVAGHSYSSGDSSSGVFGSAHSVSGTVHGVIGLTHSFGHLSCGVWGEAMATEGRVNGVKGITHSSSDSANGVFGEALATTGMVNGVTGFTHSTGNDASGVQGIALATSGNVHGVLGMTHSTHELAAGVFGGAPPEGNSAAFLGLGDLRILTLGAMLDLQPVFDVSTAESQVNMYQGGSVITSFGGPTQRVAIQKVNSSATPTIPDNNFTIVGQAPITVVTGDHGVTIGCPECCTEPCGGGGGGGCECESTLTVGGTGTDGAICTKYSDGTPMHSIDYYGISSDGIIGSGYDMICGGDFYASGTKFFLAPHPEFEDKSIRFSCTESDEVMIEHRGMVELSEGYGELQLPHEFILMSEPGTYSIMCTPQTLDIPEGIGAVVLDDGLVKIRVRGGEENMRVAFVVYATRVGYKNNPIVVQTDEIMNWKKARENSKN